MASSTPPILVIGATGGVGRAVVERLVEEGARVRALVRRPEAAGLPDGVEVVAGDLTVPESLDAGLRDVSAVFLLWTAPPATAGAVIERLAARVPRLVLLTSPHQTPHPFFQQPNPMARFHAELERLAAASRMPATILRPGMFASNTGAWWGAMIRERGVVRWPCGAAETAPVDERDIAAVAARALREEGHAGRDYLLTGPEAMSQAQQVALIGEVLGRPIRFEELTPDEFRREMADRGPIADMLLAAWQATLGVPALVTSTVADITGSPARTFRQWAADHADVFR
jgi:uncharacterized protein YbjT (DUF2867 family)